MPELIKCLVPIKKIQTPLVILPDFKDVCCFFDSNNNRGKNDELNKIRENVIEKLPFIHEDYFNHTEYGNQWSKLRDKFDNTLPLLCKNEFCNYKIKKMAGRNYNYDFNFTFFDYDYNIIKEEHLEFKHNSNNIFKLPQFLSLNINSDILKTSYSEFYYKNYLDKYLAIVNNLDSDKNIVDTNTIIKKPDLNTYLKYITSINYEVHPFFDQLRKREEIKKKEKFEVVDESIKVFLNTYGNEIDLQKLTEKFQSTQDNKMYLLWDLKDFHVNHIEKENFVIHHFLGIRNNKTIEVSSNKYKFELRLRWRNHKGILNPAWQISVKEI